MIQADVTRPDEIERMFARVRSAFGGLDFFVDNARPDLAAFYQAPMEITLEQWRNPLARADVITMGAEAGIRRFEVILRRPLERGGRLRAGP